MKTKLSKAKLNKVHKVKDDFNTKMATYSKEHDVVSIITTCALQYRSLTSRYALPLTDTRVLSSSATQQQQFFRDQQIVTATGQLTK